MRSLFISPHNDDESLFGAYTLMREKPLVLVVTDSFIQPLRGDIGCSAEDRRSESVEAAKVLGCPIAFLGIKDTELTEDILTERLKPYLECHFERIYAPSIQGGNVQHDIVGAVARKVFPSITRYTTYTKTELWTPEGQEVVPNEGEKALKVKALNCYKSQLMLPSTRPHFLAVINRSEFLI